MLVAIRDAQISLFFGTMLRGLTVMLYLLQSLGQMRSRKTVVGQ
jgi:hypothetical protein